MSVTAMSRFEGKPQKVIEALKKQISLSGLFTAQEIAQSILEKGQLKSFNDQEVLMIEGNNDQALYFLIYGKVSLHIKGRRLEYGREANYTVGELSATQNNHARTATVKADGQVVAVALSDDDFNEILAKYPEMYKGLFQDVAARLLERNLLLPQVNQRPKIFLISSVEALEVLKELQLELQHSGFRVIPWAGPTSFQAGYNIIDELMRHVNDCDFSVAIASPDDLTTSRDYTSASVRDNVIFEHGLFMGLLGKERALLAIDMKSDEKTKLPSDLQGVNPLRYSIDIDDGAKTANVATLAIALERHVKQHGVREKPKS